MILVLVVNVMMLFDFLIRNITRAIVPSKAPRPNPSFHFFERCCPILQQYSQTSKAGDEAKHTWQNEGLHIVLFERLQNVEQ